MAHRDIKPHNVFISSNGVYKVGDFGTAWVKAKRFSRSSEPSKEDSKEIFEQDSVKMTTTTGGTLQYMSPEMKDSMVGIVEVVDSFAADVYSLGRSVLHLAKLEMPEEQDTSDKEALQVAIQRDLEAMPYSQFVKDLVGKMLALDPTKRATMEEVYVKCQKCFNTDTQKQDSRGYERFSPAELSLEVDRLKAVIEQLQPEENKALADEYSALAAVYMQQTEYGRAEAACAKSIEIRTAVLGEKHIDTIDASLFLSQIYQKQGQLDKVIPMVEAILKNYASMEGEDSFETIFPGLFLVHLYYLKDRLPEALAVAQKCLQTCVRLLGDSEWTSNALFKITEIYLKQEKPQEAVEVAQKCLKMRTAVCGEEDIATAEAMFILANAYRAQGQLDSAAELGEKGLSLYVKIPGTEENWNIPALYGMLAEIYILQKKLEKALDYSERSISVSIRVCGELHSNTAVGYNRLAKVYLEQNRLPEAIEAALKSVKVFTECLGASHLQTSVAHCTLGKIYQLQNRLLEAAQEYEEVLRIYAKSGGYNNESGIIFQLGKVYEGLGRLSDAAEQYKRHLSMEAERHVESTEIATTHDMLANAYKKLRRLQEAEDQSILSMQMFIKLVGKKHTYTTVAYKTIAEVCLAEGKILGAVKFAELADTIRNSTLGKENQWSIEARVLLAECYFANGDIDNAYSRAMKAFNSCASEFGDSLLMAAAASVIAKACIMKPLLEVAETYALQAFTIRSRLSNPAALDYADSLTVLSRLHYAKKELAEAVEKETQALQVFVNNYGEDNYFTLESKKRLESWKAELGH